MIGGEGGGGDGEGERWPSEKVELREEGEKKYARSSPDLKGNLSLLRAELRFEVRIKDWIGTEVDWLRAKVLSKVKRKTSGKEYKNEMKDIRKGKGGGGDKKKRDLFSTSEDNVNEFKVVTDHQLLRVFNGNIQQT